MRKSVLCPQISQFSMTCQDSLKKKCVAVWPTVFVMRRFRPSYWYWAMRASVPTSRSPSPSVSSYALARRFQPS
jgi:hypothetical protein